MKRVLGVDLGSVRIGIAVSDELQLLAHPLETIAAGSEKAALARIRDLAKQNEAEVIVLGLPRNMDGSHGPAARAAQEFAKKLETTTNCTVVLWDERLTSVAATKAMQASGRDHRKSRPVLDQVAAQMILQGYLDRCAFAQRESGEMNAP